MWTLYDVVNDCVFAEVEHRDELEDACRALLIRMGTHPDDAVVEAVMMARDVSEEVLH